MKIRVPRGKCSRMRTAVAVAVLAASGILPVLAVRRVVAVKIIRAKE